MLRVKGLFQFGLKLGGWTDSGLNPILFCSIIYYLFSIFYLPLTSISNFPFPISLQPAGDRLQFR